MNSAHLVKKSDHYLSRIMHSLLREGHVLQDFITDVEHILALLEKAKTNRDAQILENHYTEDTRSKERFSEVLDRRIYIWIGRLEKILEKEENLVMPEQKKHLEKIKEHLDVTKKLLARLLSFDGELYGLVKEGKDWKEINTKLKEALGTNTTPGLRSLLLVLKELQELEKNITLVPSPVYIERLRIIYRELEKTPEELRAELPEGYLDFLIENWDLIEANSHSIDTKDMFHLLSRVIDDYQQSVLCLYFKTGFLNKKTISLIKELYLSGEGFAFDHLFSLNAGEPINISQDVRFEPGFLEEFLKLALKFTKNNQGSDEKSASSLSGGIKPNQKSGLLTKASWRKVFKVLERILKTSSTNTYWFMLNIWSVNIFDFSKFVKSIKDLERIVDLGILIDKKIPKENLREFYFSMISSVKALLFVKNFEDLLAISKELLKLGPNIRYYKESLAAVKRKFTLDKTNWLAVLSAVKILGWSFYEVDGNEEFLKRIFAEQKRQGAVGKRFILDLYQEFVGLKPITNNLIVKTTRIDGNRVTFITNFGNERSDKDKLHKLISERAKSDMKNRGYLTSTNLQKFIEDFTSFVIQTFTYYFKTVPDTIPVSPFTVNIRFDPSYGAGASFDGRRSNKYKVYLTFKLEYVLNSFLENLQEYEGQILHKKISEKSRVDSMASRPKSFLELIEHEYSHYLDFIHNLEPDKSFAYLFRSEGLSTFIDNIRKKFIVYNSIHYAHTKAPQTSHIHNAPYENGPIMVFFIGLGLLYKKDRKKYNSLRVYYSGKDYFTLGEGWEELKGKKLPFFFRKYSQKFSREVVQYVRKLNVRDFFEEYIKACDTIKFPEKFRLFRKSDFRIRDFGE